MNRINGELPLFESVVATAKRNGVKYNLVRRFYLLQDLNAYEWEKDE